MFQFPELCVGRIPPAWIVQSLSSTEISRACNSILLYGGGNRQITKEYVDEVLEGFGEKDILVLQNEINLLDYIIDAAYEKGMQIILNPSPFDEGLKNCNLGKVSLFFVNEIEGMLLAGAGYEAGEEGSRLIEGIAEKYRMAQIVLTMGEKGLRLPFRLYLIVQLSKMGN